MHFFKWNHVEVTNEQTPLQTAGSLVKEFNIKKKIKEQQEHSGKTKQKGLAMFPLKY